MAAGLKSHAVTELSRGAWQMWESDLRAERQPWWTRRVRIEGAEVGIALRAGCLHSSVG